MTQNERVLDYLKHHKSINPLESWISLGVYRLGARIYDLKKRGEKIVTGTQIVENRFSEKCHVACYRLEGK